jgi:hypothetical protein
MKEFAIVGTATFSLEVVAIAILTLLPRWGVLGKDITDAYTKAPWLDLLLSVMLWIPWLVGGWVEGILGIVAAVTAQIVVMQLWSFAHEFAHRQSIKKSSHIYSFLNQQFGWWRNHIALWATALVIPVFFLIRFAQVFIYPILIWMLGFPKYKHSDWINVSRHKFQGLVGQDLIWCLYCDWMTGVYSLGAEMLRNVESFWCPIRFYDGKKCENCKLDFPDLDNGWVAADGNMKDVEKVLKEKYSDRYHSWYGHPERQKE